jgi:hypothetical protein
LTTIASSLLLVNVGSLAHASLPIQTLKCGFEAHRFIASWFPNSVSGCDVLAVSPSEEVYRCTVRHPWQAPQEMTVTLAPSRGCIVLR